MEEVLCIQVEMVEIDGLVLDTGMTEVQEDKDGLTLQLETITNFNFSHFYNNFIDLFVVLF